MAKIHCLACNGPMTKTELDTVLEEFSVTDEDHPMCIQCARDTLAQDRADEREADRMVAEHDAGGSVANEGVTDAW